MITDDYMREMIGRTKGYTVHKTRRIMDDDPGVHAGAGVFTYEVHAARSVPGDALR